MRAVFIHSRSFLNERISANDPTVVPVPFADSRSARVIREGLTTPDPMRPNTSTTQLIRWIELELSADPAPLSAALDPESGRPGNSGTALVRNFDHRTLTNLYGCKPRLSCD